MSKRLLFSGLLLLSFTLLVAQDEAVTIQSNIDWHTELIHSVISLDTQIEKISLPTGRNAALQILDTKAPRLLKETFLSILINSSSCLGDMIETGEISLQDIDSVMQKGETTPLWFSGDLKQITTTHTIALADIASLFIKHKDAYQQKLPLDSTPSRAYSGILIDARGKLPVHGEYVSDRLIPCLLPRIWNTDMDLVYEKNMVNPEIALQRGIIRYTDTDTEAPIKDRIGTDPLRILARGVFGQNRTDPIISYHDYLKIVSVPENLELLEEGKVVILCDSEALEPKNLGSEKNKNYYFTKRTIETELKKYPVTKIDFSDSWKGLKLTIYDIRFIADTAKILPEEHNRLDMIANALKLAGPDTHFRVQGHTASVGKPAGELNLSIERAETITQELIARGIAADHIESSGYGGTRPIASNETEVGRAQNRRVEIILQP